MKNLLTHLDKGCRNAHPFWGFSKKLFEKIYPFTCSYWEVQNYRVFLKNFLSGKKLSHLFGIAKPNDTLFHRKIRKYFFGCGWLYFLAEKAPSLIPTGRGHLGIVILKKDKKYARRFWRAKRIPIGVLPMGKMFMNWFWNDSRFHGRYIDYYENGIFVVITYSLK